MAATEMAHGLGLKVFFNPWMMNAGRAGGAKPVRNETVQADYIETVASLINRTGAEGLFVYLFSYPVMPYRETGFDGDLTSYPLVKTFAPEDPRSRLLPPWQPKEAFYRVAEIFRKMER